MKTICDTVNDIISAYPKSQSFSGRVCHEYEKANSDFEKLVEKGTVEKRGYCLLSLENKTVYQAEVNHY